MKALTKKCQTIMAEFRKKRKTAKDINAATKELEKAFAQIADYVLKCGHFEADGEIVVPKDIEFYYHEEGNNKGLIKDPVMYHTLDHEANADYVLRRGGVLPYFKPGTLNPHLSGIDFTFENEEEQYRASFLIRGYNVNGSFMDVHLPTHLYEDLLFMGIPEGGTGIHWKEEPSPRTGKIQPPITRYNVCDYEKDSEGNYIKNDKGKYVKVELEGSKPKARLFASCTRKWRFIIV